MAKRRKKKAGKKKHPKKSRHPKRKAHPKRKKAAKRKASPKKRKKSKRGPNPQSIAVVATRKGSQTARAIVAKRTKTVGEKMAIRASASISKQAARLLRQKHKPGLAKKWSKTSKRLSKIAAKDRAKSRHIREMIVAEKANMREGLPGYKIRTKTKILSNRSNPMKRRKHPKRKHNPFFASEPAPAVARFLGVSSNQVIGFGLAGATQGVIETAIVKGLQLANLQSYASMVPGGISTISIAVAAGAQKLAERMPAGKAKGIISELAKAHMLLSIGRVAYQLAGPALQKALGMSGVVFSPMSGVVFSPMSGVQYSPLSGSPAQLGQYKGDFGNFPSSDYGGGGGYSDSRRFSPADFGKRHSMGAAQLVMDKSYEMADEAVTDEDEPVLENSMGSMG